MSWLPFNHMYAGNGNSEIIVNVEYEARLPGAYNFMPMVVWVTRFGNSSSKTSNALINFKKMH